MITVRTVYIGKDLQSVATTKDNEYGTRREALAAIRAAFSGKMAPIEKMSLVRLGRLYIFTPPAK